jgi:hypothetical protein
MSALQAVLDVRDGRRPAHVVNLEAYAHRACVISGEPAQNTIFSNGHGRSGISGVPSARMAAGSSSSGQEYWYTR